MRKRIQAWAVAVAGLITVSGVALPSQANATDYGWQFEGFNNHRCIGVNGAKNVNGRQMEMHDCYVDLTDTFFAWRPTSAGYYRLINGYGKCMNVSGASRASGIKIITYTCGGSGTLNDQWYPEMAARNYGGRDWYRLRSRNNDAMCLNVKGNSTAAGADLIQYTCNDESHNEWFTWYFND